MLWPVELLPYGLDRIVLIGLGAASDGSGMNPRSWLTRWRWSSRRSRSSARGSRSTRSPDGSGLPEATLLTSTRGRLPAAARRALDGAFLPPAALSRTSPCSRPARVRVPARRRARQRVPVAAAPHLAPARQAGQRPSRGHRGGQADDRRGLADRACRRVPLTAKLPLARLERSGPERTDATLATPPPAAAAPAPPPSPRSSAAASSGPRCPAHRRPGGSRGRPDGRRGRRSGAPRARSWARSRP